MEQRSGKYAGHGSPVLHPDVGRIVGEPSSRVNLVVACFAECDGVVSVVGVPCDAVREDRVGFAVELPESKDDVVELNDVVHLEFVGGVAVCACVGKVPFDP